MRCEGIRGGSYYEQLRRVSRFPKLFEKDPYEVGDDGVTRLKDASQFRSPADGRPQVLGRAV
jgi:hypothetical protein